MQFLSAQYSYFLGIKRGALLNVFQTASDSDDTLTLVVGPQVLILTPAPATPVDLSFCDITTAKILALNPNGEVNLWINADPLAVPPTHVLKGPMFIVADITRIALQHPGGMSDVQVEYTFAGV